MKLELFLALIVCLSSCKLQSYNADIKETTVSGMSSGGAMTQQLSLVLSSIIRKSATVAGIPFACGQGNLVANYEKCTQEGDKINIAELNTIVQDLNQRKLIDNLDFMASQKVKFLLN